MSVLFTSSDYALEIIKFLRDAYDDKIGISAGKKIAEAEESCVGYTPTELINQCEAHFRNRDASQQDITLIVEFCKRYDETDASGQMGDRGIWLPLLLELKLAAD